MTDARSQIKIRLNKVFRDVFDNGLIEVFGEMTAKDISEWDSLMHVVLVAAIQKEFGVRFSAAQIGQLKNVGEVLDLLEKHNSR